MEQLATTNKPVERSVRKTRVRDRNALLEKLVIYVLLIFAAGIVLLPLLWAFAASFTPNALVFEYASPFSIRAFFPVNFTLEAYEALFARGFGQSVLNTFVLGIVVVFVGGLVNAMAGFAFARFNFRGKRLIFIFVIMVTFLIPVDLTAIPRYILVSDLGWINTWQGLIVPGLASSTVIFLFRQFFEEIPQDLIDAARVDGAGWVRLFRSIILPISKPVLITASLLMFLSQWDSFFWPLLVAPRPDLRVVQVDIAMAVGQYSTAWSQLLAGANVAAIVPILLLLPFQRYYIQGIMSSGIKE